MIDMRSVFVVQILLLLVCFLILFNTWIQNRTRYNGIGSWFSMMGVSSIGYILLSLRGYIPDYISIIIANLLVVFAFVLFNRGVILFYRLKGTMTADIAAIGIVLALLIYFTIFMPSIEARIFVVSIAFVMIYGKSLWLIGFRTTTKQRSISKGIMLSVSGIILLNIYRIFVHLFLPSDHSDLFDQNVLDNLFLVLQVPVILLLVLNMVALVSRSLLVEVQENEEKFNSLFQFAPYAVVITRIDDATVIDANDELLKLLGYDHRELIGSTLMNLEVWVDPTQRSALIEELKNGGVINGREIDFRSKDGKIFPVLFSATILKIGEIEHIVATMKDISEINRLKDELKELASHDMLTGLANRRRFEEISAIQMAKALRSGEKLAMVMFDIDDFKCINDDYGHDVGDKVLVAIADRLRDFSRSADNVARHGGDEFTILLNGLKDRMEAETALMRLYNLYEEPIDIEGNFFMIQISCGITMFPENGTKTKELIQKADKALYVSKRKGKNSIWFASELE